MSLGNAILVALVLVFAQVQPMAMAQGAPSPVLVDGPVLQLPFGKQLERDIRPCSDGSGPRVLDYCSLGRAYKKGYRKSAALMLMPPPSDSNYAVPAWVATDVVHVSLDDHGRVGRISVYTAGPSVQDEVIRSVSGRFGKPDIETVMKQNAFGAQVLVKRASWTAPGIHVYHDCVQLDRCVVAFSEPVSVAPGRRAPVAP